MMQDSANLRTLRVYIRQFARQYKFYFLALSVIAVLAGYLQISVDYKIKEIIDTIAGDANAGLNTLLMLFVLFKLMFHGMFFLERLLAIRYAPQIIEKTVLDIYTRTVQHSLHWFDSRMAGEISSKIADFQTSVTLLIHHFFRTFNVISTIIITLVFLMHVNQLTALVLIGFILVYTPVIYFLLKKQMFLRESYVSARQESMGIINDSMANIFGIKIIGNVLTEFKLKLQPAVGQWRDWDRKTRFFDAWFIDNIDTLLVTAMSAVQIYLLAHLYQTGEITAGGFAFVAMMTLKIHSQLESLLENILFYINPNIAQLRSSYAFVNMPLDVQDPVPARELVSVKGAIEYDNVSFAYGEALKPVLSNFSVKIHPGKRLGIVGTSGAGKTTLVKCLLRYFDVHAGRVLVDGQDIRSVSQESLRAAIAIIPQDIVMFHRSIEDNLRLANYEATSAEIEQACRHAKIHDDIMLMPEGYKTVVGERGVKLSGGQRQRIAIARAILKNAPILILDEATSSLDSATEQLIQHSINDVLRSSHATVIAIAHRLSTLKQMDRIIVLDQGGIVEAGTHDELLAANGYYKKLWDMQVI